MKTMIKTTRPSLKLGLLAPLALTCLSVAPHARADNVMPAQTILVNNSESTVDQFTVDQAGTVTVNLQGLTWGPTTLNALSFSVTSANQVLSAWSGTGLTSDIATFNVGPGTYYAHIMATAGGSLDLGLYSFMMTFAPNGTPPATPLPSSGWLLLTGLFALAGLMRVVRPFEFTGTAKA
jgi:hypothetical protein